MGEEPAEKDNASEDEFAAGEQEGHIEELFLNISDDIEGTYAGDKGLDEGGLVPVADGGDKAPDDDDGTDLLLPDPEAHLNLEQYKDVEQRTKDVEKWASYIEHVMKSMFRMARNENYNGRISFKSHSIHFHFIPSSYVIQE